MALITRSVADTVAAADLITPGATVALLRGTGGGYFGIRDGRRKSDPLRSKNTSPAKAPDWQLSRVLPASQAAETVFTKRADGVSAGEFQVVRFAVTPMTADPSKDASAVKGGSGNPNVEVRVWSEQAAAFVPMATALTKTGLGAGAAYVVDVANAYGSILACFVTNSPGGVVAISAQGFNPDLL